MGNKPRTVLKSLREASSVVYGEMAIFWGFRKVYTGSNEPISLPKGYPMTENTSFWSKTQEEYTVGDSLKYAAIIIPVAMAISYVTLAAFGGTILLAEKAKKKFKDVKENRKKK